jgi:NADPH:quinone reductase-like Zn-dependent oxidoreductase
MARLRVLSVCPSIEALDLPPEPMPDPPRGANDVLIEVKCAGVNPSDGRAILGAMPQAVWPRTPGRDWSGIVLEGPSNLLGHQVFGAGGDLGITRDGTHASRLVVPCDAVVIKPANMTLEEAGALGVPFVTAQEGFHRSGLPRPGDVVLVLAVNGKVGQAAAQIAAMHGARVFGATRRDEPFLGDASAPVRIIDASQHDVAAVVRAETDGHGADIVFNTVGSPYFAVANQAMAIGARQILISTRERPVPFDIFAFYRGRHTYVGVDTLGLDACASAALLRELVPGFVSGQLKPFPVKPSNCYPLNQATAAYHAVLAGARERVVLRPE